MPKPPINSEDMNNTAKLIMHRLIARAIGRDPSSIEKARDALPHGSGYSFVVDWNNILKLPVNEVRRLITSRSENMTRLRLSSPFAFVIDLTNVDLRRRIHRIARRLVERGNILAALRRSPFVGADLDLTRSREEGRSL
jgi:hypothetical protein